MRMRSSACSALAISGPGTHLSVRVRLSHSPDQDSFHSFERDVCGALIAFERGGRPCGRI